MSNTGRIAIDDNAPLSLASEDLAGGNYSFRCYRLLGILAIMVVRGIKCVRNKLFGVIMKRILTEKRRFKGRIKIFI